MAFMLEFGKDGVNGTSSICDAVQVNEGGG
jgi:hypothetical protein